MWEIRALFRYLKKTPSAISLETLKPTLDCLIIKNKKYSINYEY